MGTSLVTARPTTSLRPSWRSIDCSPEVLSSLNTGPETNRLLWPARAPAAQLVLSLRFPRIRAPIGVGDDPRARLHDNLILEHERRADRDRGIHARRAPADV